MQLSIIVPVYNMAAEKKLEYCLDSLVAQTLADYEIIAVDDCSTDESWDILKNYEKRSVRCIWKKINTREARKTRG